MSNDVVLELKGVSKKFKDHNGNYFTAVNNVDLKLHKGEWIGLVGASGCGKSTMARIIAHLLKVDDGSIHFKGKDITNLDRKALKEFYKHLQMIFQDPLSIFSPRMKIGKFLREPFVNFKLMSKKEADSYAEELLEMVGLSREFTNKYPNELSGGQLQRVVIARAIGLKPEVLICDESTSALDVSIQQQIIELLLEFKQKIQFANIFITHDLALAENLCDRIYVMNAGEIVEILEEGDIINEATHPYTKSLIASIFHIQDVEDYTEECAN